MKDLAIWILLIALGILWFDDNSKRAAIEQLQQQVDTLQSVTAERDQLKSQLDRLSAVPAATPSWFQQRVNERPTELNH